MHPNYCYGLTLPFDIHQDILTEHNILYYTTKRSSAVSPSNINKNTVIHKIITEKFIKHNQELYELVNSMNLKMDCIHYFAKTKGSSLHPDNIHADIGHPVRNNDNQRRVAINVILQDEESTMRWYRPKPERLEEAQKAVRVGLIRLDPNLFLVDHEESIRSPSLVRTDIPHSIQASGNRICLSIGLIHNEEARNELTWDEALKLFDPYLIKKEFI